MSDIVLRKLWMDKLSPQTSQILVSLPGDLDLQRLAEIADKIYENKPPGTASATPLQPIVSSVCESQELSKIKDCIAELTSQLQALQTAMHQQNRTPNNFTSRPRPSHHTRRRSRSTSRSRPIFNTCWYHFKYGQQARHYTKPCNFDINAAKDNNTQQSGNDYPGNKRSFPWVFTITQVRTPILGADFLAHFNLSVNMSSLSLEDKTTNITRKGITSIYTSTCISATLPEANGMQDLLQKYSQITTPFRYTETVRHNAEHHIDTTGPPTHSSPRRLRPDKYKLAKDEFQHMLDLGIIGPSSSPYSSPLHMVSKPDSGAWRLCGDFRKLNATTIPDKYPIPHLHDFAVGLQGATVFTGLDLTAGASAKNGLVSSTFGTHTHSCKPFGIGDKQAKTGRDRIL
ncbi:unnamed protein product [Acanthosepion pharaonis]|uniref:Uncharacterized protein n=1 Tax=Acanthosepion pharaonis TaxID=158019 RepID=A0A812BF40_ACAPH|nr:unnamed protein product [Sepia pharaonis]